VYDVVIVAMDHGMPQGNVIYLYFYDFHDATLFLQYSFESVLGLQVHIASVEKNHKNYLEMQAPICSSGFMQCKSV